jgi:hypothetical protein
MEDSEISNTQSAESGPSHCDNNSLAQKKKNALIVASAEKSPKTILSDITFDNLGQTCQSETIQNVSHVTVQAEITLACNDIGNLSESPTASEIQTVEEKMTEGNIIDNTQNADDLYASPTDEEDLYDAVEISSSEPNIEQSKEIKEQCVKNILKD